MIVAVRGTVIVSVGGAVVWQGCSGCLSEGGWMAGVEDGVGCS